MRLYIHPHGTVENLISKHFVKERSLLSIIVRLRILIININNAYILLYNLCNNHYSRTSYIFKIIDCIERYVEKNYGI